MADVNLYAKNLNIIEANECNVGQGYTWSLDANRTLRLASYDPIDRSVLSPIMYINNSGQVGIGTAEPNVHLHVVGDTRLQGNLFNLGDGYNLSDARYKKDLTQIPHALQKVTQLTGYTYARTDLPATAPRKVGVIAQDVQTVLPEAVLSDPDGVLSVSYDNLVPLLIESVKDLKKEVDAMRQLINDTFLVNIE